MLDFNAIHTVQRTLSSFEPDVTLTVTEAGTEIESIFVYYGVNFRVVTSAEGVSIESADDDFDNVRMDANLYPTSEWILRTIIDMAKA